MVNFPPEYCPYCGTELDPVDEPRIYSCDACERRVFHNPTPSARVLVLDDDRILLVRQGVGAVEGSWLSPGGKIEIGNDPAEHAAIELEEETGLAVHPDDLVLCNVGSAEAPEDHHIVSILYAVEYASTSGSIEAGSDAAEARFFTPSELASLDQFDQEAVDWYADVRSTASEAVARASG